MIKKAKVLLVTGLVLAAGSVQAETINGINVDFVSIGNAGNAADSTSYGAVGYNYRIGQTEVTIDQFSASGIGNGNEGEWSALGGTAPAVKISWHEAGQFCNWLTSGDANLGAYTISGGAVSAVDRAAAISTYGTVYVLPTEDEWYKAAYYTGSGYSLYANGTSTAPVAEVDAIYNRASVTGPWTVGTGAVEQNGTLNMMGNIWEQLESAFDGSLDSSGEDMAYRGGDYFLGASKLVSGNREPDSPDSEWSNLGFRVVAIPEPGTISLMSLSTMGLFLTRRVRRRKQAGKTLFPIRREHHCDTFEERSTFDAVEEDYLTEFIQASKASLAVVRNDVRNRYASLDKIFWNRMVITHEHRVERKNARTMAFKKKIIDGFDAFLALIMK